MFSRVSPWSLPDARCLAVDLPFFSSLSKSTPFFRSSSEGRDLLAASLALSAKLLAASAKMSRVRRMISDPICLNSGEVTIKLAMVRNDSIAGFESRESSLEEAGTEAALMSTSISALAALYYRLSDRQESRVRGPTKKFWRRSSPFFSSPHFRAFCKTFLTFSRTLDPSEPNRAVRVFGPPVLFSVSELTTSSSILDN